MRETRRILRAAAALRGTELRGMESPPRQPRFGFDFPGATRGFEPDREPHHAQAITSRRNRGAGLEIAYERLTPGRCGRLTGADLLPPRAERGARHQLF